MSNWEGLNRKREATPELLAGLDELLARGTIKSVHYSGYAHEPILRLLHHHLGTAFSVMDFPDRFSSSAGFWRESPDEYFVPPRPDWLEGVAFYQEGAPDTDLLIIDVAFSFPGALVEIIKLRRASYLLLVNEARTESRHPDYTWVETPAYALGTLNPHIAPTDRDKKWR